MHTDPTQQIGRRTVLPASFIGSPRDFQGRYLDAVALVARYGPHPDLFITFTANPHWPEIQEGLLPHQQSSDRPDLQVRSPHAFHLTSTLSGSASSWSS